MVIGHEISNWLTQHVKCMYSVHSASARCEAQAALPDSSRRRGRSDVANNKINQPTRVIMVFPPCNNNYIIVESFYELLCACRSFYLPFFMLDAASCSALHFIVKHNVFYWILYSCIALHHTVYISKRNHLHFILITLMWFLRNWSDSYFNIKFNKYIEYMTRPTKS